MKCQTPNFTNNRLELKFVKIMEFGKGRIIYCDEMNFKFCDDCLSKKLIEKLEETNK